MAEGVAEDTQGTTVGQSWISYSWNFMSRIGRGTISGDIRIQGCLVLILVANFIGTLHDHTPYSQFSCSIFLNFSCYGCMVEQENIYLTSVRVKHFPTCGHVHALTHTAIYYVGEKLAYGFGITTPDWQYAIDVYEDMKQEEQEEREEEERALQEQQRQLLQRMKEMEDQRTADREDS